MGEERTTIQNSGDTLMMIVRGVRFQDNNFDGFEPQFDVTDTVSEVVQETYLCPEFARRNPKTGYRG